MTRFADIRTLNTRQGLADTPIGGFGLFSILHDGVEVLRNEGYKERKRTKREEKKRKEKRPASKNRGKRNRLKGKKEKKESDR